MRVFRHWKQLSGSEWYQRMKEFVIIISDLLVFDDCFHYIVNSVGFR